MEKIIEKVISLEEHGLNDLAWSKEDAINLIQSIMKDRVGILGGDVCELTSNRLKFCGDNWACRRIQTESEEAYNLRSKIKSLQYIEKYPVPPNKKIIFVLVFTEQVCL